MDDRFFSTKRLRQSTTSTNRTNKQQFESDRGRILFSAPLRRMQSKAQVFSLEENASVRSRLTHSMEVAHIGRYISHKISEIASTQNAIALSKKCSEIEPLVETACYLHDIGNPPFGHLGESAIQDWFRQEAPRLYKAANKFDIDKDSSFYKDFLNFDGNPQAARIVLTLQGLPDKMGYNLTSAQIGALVKYPKYSDENPKKPGKIAAFTAERQKLNSVWDNMGLTWGKRHPLVLLMEAADDISYCLSDIEDGIEKEIIDERSVISYLKSEFRTLDSEILNCVPDIEDTDVVTSPFVTFRTRMTNLMVEKAAKEFVTNIDRICSGEKSEIFDKSGDAFKALEIIRKFCRKSLYSSPKAEDIEIAGYNIVYGLLDKFSVLMALETSAFLKLIDNREGSPLSTRMFGKLPPKLIGHYKVNSGSKDEWYYRLHLIIDHISGMTDDYALRLFRLLNGIDVKTV